MKKHLALAVAIFGLLALATVARGDSIGGRGGSSDTSFSSDMSSRSVDRWGGYWNSDNHYWWNGGYWEGGCYGCGRWICIGCNYPSCPPCQWFNHERWECEYTEACSSVGVVGRKMLAVPAQAAA
ncbi:hypothetical protein WJX75_001109 [Coccomyxa subellipsoidea]|uniref:Uncharacterized protein n=1 Tax=Coccomyxa subellipsoidea TaxID=248742 RepID=A0ABR2YZN1_9CHLO